MNLLRNSAIKLLVALALAIGAMTPPAFATGWRSCTAARSLAVTTVTGNVQLGTCDTTIIIYNVTSQEVFYAVGTSSGTAASTSTSDSIPGNFYVIVDLPKSTTGMYLAGITAATTTTLRVVMGKVI